MNKYCVLDILEYTDSCIYKKILIMFQYFLNIETKRLKMHKLIDELNYDTYLRIIVERGDIDWLKYTRDIGYEWNWFTCAFLATIGNLECLKYLHESGCERNLSTCIYAAKNGHLDCLKYAHENGCTNGCTNVKSFLLSLHKYNRVCTEYIEMCM